MYVIPLVFSTHVPPVNYILLTLHPKQDSVILAPKSPNTFICIWQICQGSEVSVGLGIHGHDNLIIFPGENIKIGSQGYCMLGHKNKPEVEPFQVTIFRSYLFSNFSTY